MFVHARLIPSILLLVMSPGLVRASEQHWQRVMSGDSKVGMVEHTRRVEGDRVFTAERLTLELGKFGRRVTYQLTLDTESTTDGQLIRVVRDAVTRESHARVEARAVGADLQITIGARHPTVRILRDVAAALRTDEYTRAWRLAVAGGAHEPPLRFRAFDATRAEVMDVELSPMPTAERRPRIQRLAHSGNDVTARYLTLGTAGEVVEEALRLGGLQLTLLGATEAEARAPNRALDHVVGQFQKSPYRFPANSLRGKIRYAFDNGGRAPRIPVGGGQRTWSDGQTTWIQVCADCAPDEMALSDEARARAVRPTPWLNYQDPALTKPAQRMARADDPSLTMRRLTNYVRNHMSVEHIDMLGFGSALEAFRSRRGDCTEYAVLLAAMGRAGGVPTRVVSGLVYSRSFEGQNYVFVPHVWVQAWTGSGWESFDAALGRFDSTHLALAASEDGDPTELFAGINLGHELRITSAARVLPRKAAK